MRSFSNITCLWGYFAVSTLAAAAGIGIECEDFQFSGNWRIEPRDGASAERVISSGDNGAATPAATAIRIPASGRYTLWVRATDFPQANPGARYFHVSVGGRKGETRFGTSGRSGWTWEKGDAFELPAGPVLIAIHDNHGMHYARPDALILTPDPDFTPQGTLDQTGVRMAERVPIDVGTAAVPMSEVTGADPSSVMARLANEHLELTFIAARRAGKSTVVPMIRTRCTNGWQRPPLAPSAESYQVLVGGKDTELQGVVNSFHPVWNPRPDKRVSIEVNGVREVVSATTSRNTVWDAGVGEEHIPQAARQVTKDRVGLDFHRGPSGELTAVWELKPGEKSARLTLRFRPDSPGQYSLGYFPPFESGMNEVAELLLPPVVNRRRFPEESFTVLAACMPTPVSLMELRHAGGPLTLGVAAAAEAVPPDFPKPVGSRFGLQIRNARGKVQPSIYGPLVGTRYARVKQGETIGFPLRLLAESGDWYDAYRTAADEIHGWRDYRKNGRVSLTDAVLNMIDLYMDDEFGGWWEAGKGFYQIEGKNSVTRAAPLLAPSLHRLTGNHEVYERRVRPTLAYLLSRDGVHFAPIPEGSRDMMRGTMRGPCRGYGTTVFGNLDILTGGRMPLFREIALPGEGVRGAPRTIDPVHHKQPFDEWLGRYLLTGEEAALKRAIASADEYIAQVIKTPPTGDLSVSGFFLMQYTPAWEGLLHLYEATGEKRFLDAAAFGARQVMTGMWTQPAPRSEAITIHPGGMIDGDKMHLRLHKGSETFRLGFPIKPGAIVEKQVPEWLVSHVGLGLEQPSTYSYRDNGGRMILQANWAPGFLRLARHTGDKQFATYARNATVGRWGNYPGYYYTTHTDLAQDPRFPYTGPDVGFFYYHHIPPHLAWNIDYLVSDAYLLSDGAVEFPGLRQRDYAYFDNLVYGHAQGEVFGGEGAWLWFRRGLVELDNPQVNYLTAHDGKSFHLVLMNQSHGPETVRVRFHPAEISPQAGDFTMARLSSGGGREIPLRDRTAVIELPPRGLAALRVDGLRIDVPTHRELPEPGERTAPGFVEVAIKGAPGFRAAALQVAPGAWDACVWSTAQPRELRSFTVEWTAGGKTGRIEDTDGYPFELMIPVEAGVDSLEFRITGVLPDGGAFTTQKHKIGAAR